MSKISVCIPSYNHEKYIYHTIESVLNQSFQDFEIIISDDNSSDNTLEIAKTVTGSICIEYTDHTTVGIGWTYDGINFINPNPIIEETPIDKST